MTISTFSYPLILIFHLGVTWNSHALITLSQSLIQRQWGDTKMCHWMRSSFSCYSSLGTRIYRFCKNNIAQSNFCLSLCPSNNFKIILWCKSKLAWDQCFLCAHMSHFMVLGKILMLFCFPVFQMTHQWLGHLWFDRKWGLLSLSDLSLLVMISAVST